MMRWILAALMLLVAAACLIGVCVAEPQPGDAVIEPEAAERRVNVGGLLAVGVCGLFGLTALWCCLRWGRGR